MGVVNKYVNALTEAGKISNAAFVDGGQVVQMVETEELTAGDSATSVYRFFKGVSGNLIITDIKLYSDDAITDEVDGDIGIYNQSVFNGDDGAVINADYFKATIDFTTAGGWTRGGGVIGHEEALDGMGSVDIANLKKKLYEHAGHTVATAKAGYDICLTINTGVTTTGGTVTMIVTGILG